MITLPPYIVDRIAYDFVPDYHKWIFNKLEICKRFGYRPYGVCGEVIPPGVYCIRPIMNLNGMAKGGFWKHESDREAEIIKPGYCWVPWADGPRSWVEYMNDEVVSANIQVGWDEETQMEEYAEQPRHEVTEIPSQLRGISRYMLVEFLGDVVIDIGPRHMLEEPLQSVLDDYRRIDPGYDYQGEDAPGTIQQFMQRVTNNDGSWGWKEVRTALPRSIYK